MSAKSGQMDDLSSLLGNITYTQVNIEKSPTRVSFRKVIEEEFNAKVVT